MLYDFKQTSRHKKDRLAKVTLFFPFFLIPLILILSIPVLKQINLPAPSNFDQFKRAVLKHPRNPQAHLQLAEFYLQTNNLKRAKQEVALDLDSNSQEARDLKTTIENQEEAPERIKAQIHDWEQVLREKPGYRDAFFQIAVLNWQIYQEQEAREAISKALELDPNFESAKKFKSLLDL